MTGISLSKMDLQNLEAWSHVKQATVRFILHELRRLGIPLTDQRVILSMVNHFNGQAPLQNHCFNGIVIQFAQGYPNPNQ